MTVFYTLVGFDPEPFVRVTAGCYDARPRIYSTPGGARCMRTHLVKRVRPGVSYRILETVIHSDGVESTSWID